MNIKVTVNGKPGKVTNDDFKAMVYVRYDDGSTEWVLRSDLKVA